MQASCNQVRMASIVANILVTTIITFKLCMACITIVIMTMEAYVNNELCN